MNIIGIIPARFGSTRFPGKPLAMIRGKTMIQLVVEQAQKATTLSQVIVATDDERIYDHVLSFGGMVVMTSSTHNSGTDRCLEALSKTGGSFDAVVNIQGDEPFADPSQIDALCALVSQPHVEIATLAKRITNAESMFNHNEVKVVAGVNGRALYFSRQCIPYQKGIAADNWLMNFPYFRHLGLYAYKTAILEKIAALPPSPLEIAESLEQLRWLENGFHIYLGYTDIETISIDTPQDLLRAQNLG